MNRQPYLVFLVFLVWIVVFQVKCESSIEVDENGDEYEVKRFNIKGRQLNEGRSQCVVSRRKRATQPQPVYNDGGSNDEADNTDDGDAIRDREQQPLLFYSPPLFVHEEGDEEENDEVKDTTEMNKLTEDDNMEENNKNRDEEISEMAENAQDTDNKEEDNDNTFEVMHLSQSPVFAQLQSDEVPAVTTASSPSDNASDTNGIFVVQSHFPPKVNPETHALFELLPVNHIDVTSAIGSTDEEIANDISVQNDSEPIRAHEVVKKPKKPLSSHIHMKKLTLKPRRKNKPNNSHKSGLTNGDKKRRNNKTHPNKTSLQRPINTRRRGSQKNKITMIRPQNVNGYQYNKYGVFNNRNRLVVKRKKNKKNGEVTDEDSGIITHTVTIVQADQEDVEKNFDCIIIRKDPPPTTAPSFWNIFKPNVKSSPRASGHFGMRKRVSVRFVA